MTCRPEGTSGAEGFANSEGPQTFGSLLPGHQKLWALGIFVARAHSELLICWSFLLNQVHVYGSSPSCALGIGEGGESVALLPVVNWHFIFTA